MSGSAIILSCLRRSGLAAWLAVVYALAVLAGGLTPAPVVRDGLRTVDLVLVERGVAALCAAADRDDAPDGPQEPGHCLGCLPGSFAILARPPAATVPEAVPAMQAVLVAAAVRDAAPRGLVRSRGPPRA